MSPFSAPVLGAAALLASSALWQAVVDGTLPLEVALTRYLIAVGIAWVALSALVGLVGDPPARPAVPTGNPADPASPGSPAAPGTATSAGTAEEGGAAA